MEDSKWRTDLHWCPLVLVLWFYCRIYFMFVWQINWLTSGGSMLGPWGHSPPPSNLAQAPKLILDNWTQ